MEPEFVHAPSDWTSSPLIDRAKRIAALILSPRAYPFILAVSAAIIAYRLVRELNTHDMGYLYLEYLPTYDFGFIRRGFVPHLLSYGLPQLTHLHVKIFAATLICITIAAYVAMYVFRFGLNARELPLLAITCASPCVFKNFIFDFARLDIFGFVVAVVALTLPLSVLYPLMLGGLACLLILIHEGQFLSYIPVIVCIAAIRIAATSEPLHVRFLLPALSALAAIVVTFALVLAYGAPDVPHDQLFVRLKERAIDPVYNRVFLWYINPIENMHLANASDMLWRQASSIHKYVLILAAHLPLLLFARRETLASPPAVRIIVMLSVLAITVALTVMFVISHDKARWFATWLTGLILVTHAIRLVRRGDAPDTADLQTPIAVGAAWLMALIGRTGLMTPL
jgi:hypothetical protein